MSFATDKAALITHLKSVDCNKIPFILPVQDYEGLFYRLTFHLETFNCIPDDLKEILNLFPDSVLLGHGIHYNKSGNILNPVIVVGGTLGEITFDTTIDSVYILGGATANKITVKSETNIDYMLISGGSIIQDIEVEEGSEVENLNINTCRTFNSSITSLYMCDTPANITYIWKGAMMTVPATTTLMT